MRQVFTSARLENVESVAEFLNDAGIATKITNGRSFRSAIRGNFSYRDDAAKFPAVWIVYSEDQPRARAMLRDAGLMDSSRNAPGSDLAMSFRGTNPDPRERVPGDGVFDHARQRRALRIKLGLLILIAAVVMLALVTRGPSTSTPLALTAAPAAKIANIAQLPVRGGADVPASLALAVLRGEVPTDAGAVACVAVDGSDAAAALLAALPSTPARVVPVSQCPERTPNPKSLPLILAIGTYTAGPSGAGTVAFQRRRLGGLVITQSFSVRPEGDGWRVIQLLDTKPPPPTVN
ncbi:MAG: hypothetical protein ACREO8_02630 [Luteimonas sp.]